MTIWLTLALLALSLFAPDAPPSAPHVVQAIFGLDDLLVVLLIQVIIAAVSYVLAPKPQTAQPPATTPWTDPQASAGNPIPVVFGTLTITGPNVLWFGEKSIQATQVPG